MLATLPPASSTANNTQPAVMRKRYWPLNELQEQVMTLAAEQETKSIWRQSLIKRSRSSAVRCNSCHRKFHSVGNLATHQQLYKH